MDILTDDEINDAWAGVSGSCPEIEINDLARALEQRILTKIRSAEPVIWTDEKAQEFSLHDCGACPIPLYTHPAPSEGDRRDAEDAARYRWLRKGYGHKFHAIWGDSDDQIDSAIDAVRAAMSKEQDAARTPSEKGGR